MITFVGDKPGFVHRRVVGAIDRDRDELRGAIDRRDGERVGQRAAGVERLGRAVVVVERIALSRCDGR